MRRSFTYYVTIILIFFWVQSPPFSYSFCWIVPISFLLLYTVRSFVLRCSIFTSCYQFYTTFYYCHLCVLFWANNIRYIYYVVLYSCRSFCTLLFVICIFLLWLRLSYCLYNMLLVVRSAVHVITSVLFAVVHSFIFVHCPPAVAFIHSLPLFFPSRSPAVLSFCHRCLHSLPFRSPRAFMPFFSLLNLLCTSSPPTMPWFCLPIHCYITLFLLISIPLWLR